MKELTDWLIDWLPEFKDHLSEISSCATFDACRENIKISQIMGASPEEQEKMSGLLVSSDTYCR